MSNYGGCIKVSSLAAAIMTVVLTLGLTRAASAQQTPPPHTSPSGYGLFLDPSVMMGICAGGDSLSTCSGKLQTEAVKYYQAIGIYQPGTMTGTSAKGTFKAWKATMGFNDDPNAPLTAGETRAIYFNNGDLQFARDMHCRTVNNSIIINGRPTLATVFTYTCYVSNSSDDGPNQLPGAGANPDNSIALAAAAHPTPIATVVMEVTATRPVLRIIGAPPPAMTYGDVSFFVYDKNGNPSTTAQLDSQVPKAVPGLCMACHGGTYAASSAGTPAVHGGNFLPFDTGSFKYSSTNLQLTELAQREAFRKLNGFVKTTAPTSVEVSQLVDGWYQWCGGVNQTGCYIDETNYPYLPGTWATGGPATASFTSFDTRGFYTQVVAKKCRTCHVALADRFDVQHDFVSDTNGNINAQLVRLLLFSRHDMPFGEVPYNDFWSGTSGLNQQSAARSMRTFSAQCPTQLPKINFTPEGFDVVDLLTVPDGSLDGATRLSLQLAPVSAQLGNFWKQALLKDAQGNVLGNVSGGAGASTTTVSTVVSPAAPNPGGLDLWKGGFLNFGAFVWHQPLSSGGLDFGDCSISVNWKADQASVQGGF